MRLEEQGKGDDLAIGCEQSTEIESSSAVQCSTIDVKITFLVTEVSSASLARGRETAAAAVTASGRW